MSLSGASEDYWSATTRCTIGERCKFIFNNELLSDVEFVVQDAEGGSESIKKIPAHRFILAISSPVFYAMFYGELAEKKDSIDVSNCDHKSLLELFRFVYSDEVKLNADNVVQVLYLAKKYMLPSLADKCTEFLREKVDASNVFHVLPVAQKYEEKGLVDHCWVVIDSGTDEAVKSDGFVTIEKSVLEALVERDSLNVKEVELFKAVDSWATKQCEKQGLAAANGSVKRRILGERIVKAIRFPLMEQQEFAGAVLDSDILTKKELSDMMKYFSSLLTFPVEYSETSRGGPKRKSRFSRFWSGYKVKGWHHSALNPHTLVVSVDKKINLFSIRLFGSESNKYSVTLKVTDASGVALTTKTGTFMSELMQNEGAEYHGFDIVFKPPVVLQAGKQYFLEATMIGPPSWYGRDGSSQVKHDTVTFSFANTEGVEELVNTTVSNGQFFEFEFITS